MGHRAAHAGVRVLAGDIGGTKTRLAVFTVGPGRLRTECEAVYRSRSHGSLGEILDHFLGRHPAKTELACFGLAGPVREGRCETTNLPWVVDAGELKARFGFRRVALLNDLEATAWGIRALPPEDLRTLSPGAAGARGNASVIAAGTGLGEAGLYWDGREHWPFASEGGHADFSPANASQCRLRAFLAQHYGHVSWERVVSGPGLVDIHRFVLEERGAVAPAWLTERMERGDPAAEITRAARERSEPACREALGLFASLYGAEAGNHALKLMSTGGVYLGGGIAPRILEWLEGGAFLEAFRSKGRMERLLRDMPVRVVLNDRTALYGPAVYMARAEGGGGP